MTNTADKAMREALDLAMDNLRDHSDNCFLHDEGEYNACFCGKAALVDHLQSVLEAALASSAAAPEQAEPVAWRYEVATCRYNGVYGDWQWRLTMTEPCVPEAAIRNLSPLYTHPSAPAAENEWTETPTDPTMQSIEAWFACAMPNPTERNRSVQVGCLLEEVAELMEALGDEGASFRIMAYASYYKAGPPTVPSGPLNQLALADALADIQVTASGVAYLYGIDAPGALAEVNRSNWSKFVDGKPVFDANGKIAKGPNYLAPDLREFA